MRPFVCLFVRHQEYARSFQAMKRCSIYGPPVWEKIWGVGLLKMADCQLLWTFGDDIV